MTINPIQIRLQKLADKDNAEIAQRFFKTGPGEYGEGDRFLGIRVPVLRKLAKEYRKTSIAESDQLLKSPFHEARLLALLLLIQHYRAGEEPVRKRIYTLYLKRTRQINNWDLVDTSAEHIVGAYLLDRDKKPLTNLVLANDLWKRRIAVMATFHFIKQGEFSETLRISELLLHDQEDLIHKSVGWMLREVGKRDLPVEEGFLKRHYQEMPRTMLRYAIEKFPEERRQRYLQGRVRVKTKH
ncbi:MAG: DNA alkylation repair protein [Bacteroidetes bacterium]|nr:DNA alkylation repair protein [Bacteroidota bacterium]